MDVDLDHPAIAGYLARLEAAAAGLPQWRREELVAEIRSHLNEALLTAADGDDAAIRSAVDRLGDPADIVAAEGAAPAPPTPPPPPYGTGPIGGEPASGAPRSGLGAGWGPVELIAVIGLAVGVLTAGVGLLIGIICTWISDRWTTREKVVATAITSLVVLLVLLPALFLVVARSGEPHTSEITTPVTSVETVAPTPMPGGTP